MQRRQPRIISGETCWLCPTCELWKPKQDYYADVRNWNGIGGQCRKCHSAGNVRTRNKDTARIHRRESMARQRLSNPEKYKERDRISARNRVWTEKSEARYQLNIAVRRREIFRPERCSKCGVRGRIHAHHADYSKPLFVEWLCTLCHGKKHHKTQNLNMGD